MFLSKTKLAQAVTMAMAGAALSAGGISTASAASTTMYNTFTTTDVAQTDGWVWGGIGYHPTKTPNGIANPNGNISGNLPVGAASFVGINGSSTPSTSTPFGYVGSSQLNWAVEIGAVGDSAEVSQADSTKYGISAEIDTGAGAYRDSGGGDPTKVTGWKHQTDIGLIRNDTLEDMFVTLKLTRVGAISPPGETNDNFGITVFAGMDSNFDNEVDSNSDGIRGYSHHGAWNAGGIPSTTNNPFGTNGVNYLTHDESVDSLNGLTFTALAGQIYSIYLGGSMIAPGFNGDWNDNVSGYQLNITTSAVPIPAAVWLFGSALAGFGVIGRRREKASVKEG